MKIGDSARLKIVGTPENGSVKVFDIDAQREGVLLIKSKLKVNAEGLVKNAWIVQSQNGSQPTLYGNSYFGKWDIRPNLREDYLRIISAIYKTPDIVKHEDISVLKGMANRCLRHDQWDWFTTYTYLGMPDVSVLKNFVSDAIAVRDELKNGSHVTLHPFAERYKNILLSIQFFLKRLNGETGLDTSIAPESFSKDFWGRLSEDSRRNILIIEHCMNDASQFILMHFFVTVESEFRYNFIEPFQTAMGSALRTIRAFDVGERPTHDILVGRSEMTLGSVEFFGRFLSRPDNLIYSESIRKFKAFLGSDVADFVSLCSDLANAKVNNVRIRDMRNMLAHGDSSLFRGKFNIAHSCDELRNLLLAPQDGYLVRMVALSKR